MESLAKMFVELVKSTTDPLVLVVVVCLFALGVVYGCVKVLAGQK
jgi:hypothetical protein